jgi:hypothetical protein
VLAILAVPAASILGGATCSTVRLAVIPAHQPDYASIPSDYASIPSQLLAGVSAGLIVAYAAWRLLRAGINYWEPDRPPWPPIVVSGWIMSAAIPVAMAIAYGALLLGLMIGEAIDPRGDAASIFMGAMTSSTAGFASLLFAWQSYRYGK